MTKFSKITTLGIIIGVLVVAGFSVWFFNTKEITTSELQQKKLQVIRNEEKRELGDIRTFESCIAAGYPIFDTGDSLFRKCKISDEKTFQEEISVRLREERGIVILEPAEGQQANDSVKIRGSVKNTRFMQNISVAAWKSAGEYAGNSRGSVFIPISEDGSFEVELELPFGSGWYQINISAPAIQERTSPDDVVHYRVAILNVISIDGNE